MPADAAVVAMRAMLASSKSSSHTKAGVGRRRNEATELAVDPFVNCHIFELLSLIPAAAPTFTPLAETDEV